MKRPRKPSTDDWRALYEKAIQVRELAPWSWMEEAEVFGVQNPESGEFGFVSVMGMAGEHYAVALYLGERAVYNFRDLHDSAPWDTPEQLLEIPELQASFEDRQMLGDRDRSVISDLRLKFHGKNAWPMFRNYGYALFPWYIEQAEARFLSHALEQLLDVAPRFRENPTMLDPYDDERYLVRVSHEEDGILIWEDRIMAIHRPPPAPVRVDWDAGLIERFKLIPQSNIRIEVDLFILHSPVQDAKGERPYFPYVLLPVEASSGFVLDSQLLRPLPSLETMRALIPTHFVKQLLKHNMRPTEVMVRSSLLYELLKRLADSADFKLIESNILPELDSAKNSLFSFMDRRGKW